MNALTHWNQLRWNQLNQLEDLQHTLRSLFSRPRWPKEQMGVPQWIPLVDVSEDATGYVIRAELPQVKQQDVKITLSDGTLTITGDRKFDQNSKKDHHFEHAYGRFAHSFTLPADARPAQVRAVFKDEVLTVYLARNEKGSPGKWQAEVALQGRCGEGTALLLPPETHAYEFDSKQD